MKIEFKIEKEIPIPKRSNEIYPISDMKPGDSIFFPIGFFITKNNKKIMDYRTHHQRINSIFRARKKKDTTMKNWEFTGRRIEGGVRYWRTK